MLAELQQVPGPFVTRCTRHRDYTRWCCYLYWRHSLCFWWCHRNFGVFRRCTYCALYFVQNGWKYAMFGIWYIARFVSEHV